MRFCIHYPESTIIWCGLIIETAVSFLKLIVIILILETVSHLDECHDILLEASKIWAMQPDTHTSHDKRWVPDLDYYLHHVGL